MSSLPLTKHIQHLRNTPALSRANAILSVMNTILIRWIFLVAIIALGIFYVWLVNSSATAGFYLSDLDKRVTKLDDEYRTLEVQQAQLQSLEHIEQQSKALQMVSSPDIQYARRDDNVALRDE